jgi:hypothetical protein
MQETFPEIFPVWETDIQERVAEPINTTVLHGQ